MKKKKINLYQIIFLLVAYSLIRIGRIPLYLVLRIKHYALNAYSKIISFPGKFSFQKRGRPKQKKQFKFTRKAIFFSLIIFIVIIFYSLFLISLTSQLPSPARLYNVGRPITSEIYDRNNKLLYRIFEDRNRSFIKLNDLPPFLIQATIAIEDKNFYHHSGIDLGAIIRAVYHNYKNGSLEGASTITQQLVKNTLLTSEKTYTRKIKEIVLSILTERIYSKDKILEMYFNEAPYGGPVWGIRAAAQTYFDKEPKELSLAESAFLAGLPASPTEFSPYGASSYLGMARQKRVIWRMIEEKYISREEGEKALNEKLTFKPQSEDINAPHFVFYVKDYLSKKYGLNTVSQGGLKVITTLDLDLQREIEEIVKNEVDNLSYLNVKNGAAMVMDPKTGQILAMVGSRDYKYPDFGNFNVTLALRQPGSSIKPITYATAFKQGFSPANTILDIPTTFKNQWESYSPVNYDGRFHGPVSIRVALASSLNIPAVKMLASVGIDSMIKTAKDLGITTFEDPGRYGLSLTLGGGEVKMIDMMAVYSVFSQMGIYHKPAPILKVTDSYGNILEEYAERGKKALEPEVAYLIDNILSDNNARSMAFGTNSLLNLTPDIVGVKTGTTDNKRDNWTFGFTKDFVVGAWVGNPDNSPMNPKLTSGITGAAPIWQKITKILLQTNPGLGFDRPAGIVDATVDGRTDLAILGLKVKSLARIRADKDQTIFSDAFSSYATQSAQANLKDAPGTTNN